jgi:hypothetical protein
MELNRALTPNSDQLVASQILANQAGQLLITNVGPTLVPGDRFQLFSKSVTGGFAGVELPATDASGASYTWQNDIAVNGSIRVLTATGGMTTTPTNLVVSAGSDGSLTLSWPAEYVGWSLEAQTNSGPAGLGTNWVKVPGANATNQFQMPIDPANGSVFFRMVLP